MSDPGLACGDPRDTSCKYLTFFLGEERYALDVEHVYEIIRMTTVTPVPRTSSHVLGVINLRGKVIAVVDLRANLGMQTVLPNERTCIVIVQAHDRELGIVVDKVSDVSDVRPEQIEPPPSLGSSTRTEFLMGMIKLDRSIALIVDIGKLIPEEEIPGQPVRVD